jgi:hypothetical protein
MTGYLLDKVVSDGKDTIDTLKEVVPFIVIGVLWLLGAIAKTIQSGKKKGNRPEIQQKTEDKQRRPENLADFIRIVKEQYAAAKKQAIKTVEQASEKVSEIQQPITRPYEESFRKPPMFEVTTPVPPPAVEKLVVKEPPPALEPVLLTTPVSAKTKVEPFAEMITVPEIYKTYRHPYLAELTKQFSDADGLRKAVLYSEILGRPVALRRE